MDLRRRTCLILASLLTISFISGTVCGVGESVGEKVKLELYYETLCPYCSRFIVKYLIDVFESGVISIVDLNLVPYGNAKIGPNATITCQHGPSECLLNTIEACAIYVWPDVNAHFPFIYCVENLVYEGKYPEWEMCFEKLGLDPKPVTDCYINGKGNQLELQYAVETNSLEPRHTYVPWVVVDGKPLYDDYENVISYICKAYRGTDVPHACSEQLFTIIHKEKMNFIYPGCYSKDTTKSTVSRTRSGITSWIRPFKGVASI